MTRGQCCPFLGGILVYDHGMEQTVGDSQLLITEKNIKYSAHKQLKINRYTNSLKTGARFSTQSKVFNAALVDQLHITLKFVRIFGRNVTEIFTPVITSRNKLKRVYTYEHISAALRSKVHPVDKGAGCYPPKHIHYCTWSLRSFRNWSHYPDEHRTWLSLHLRISRLRTWSTLF